MGKEATVSDLAQWIQPLQAQMSTRAGEKIFQLTQDSRKTDNQSVFFAVGGPDKNGHAYLRDVFSRKPLAVVVHEDVESLSGLSAETLSVAVQGGVSIFRVHDVKHALTIALNEFFEHPSNDMFVIGITGTNGKTTSTYLLEFLFSQINCVVGVMGTINHHVGNRIWDTSLTTPGVEEVYRRLSEFREAGANVVALEVTSHALDQGRARGLQFDAALFTNLTRDHLDYHKTFENYHAAKQLLFTQGLGESRKPLVAAILNGEDGAVMKTKFDARAEVISFFDSTHHSFPLSENRKFRALPFRITKKRIQGISLEMKFSDLQTREFATSLVGDFNAQNLAMAIAAFDFYLRVHRASEREALLDLALGNFKNFNGVRGRLQRVPSGHRTHIFVDYAHTDDALKNALTTLREADAESDNSDGDDGNEGVGRAPRGRLIVIFGCGGDRDRGKRPLMGAVASQLADIVIVTSDNPRTEDPIRIIDEILVGIKNREDVIVQPDRRLAIHHGVELMKENDILLVAGKGHETYQIVGQEKRHFDDVEQIEEGLKSHAQKP